MPYPLAAFPASFQNCCPPCMCQQQQKPIQELAQNMYQQYANCLNNTKPSAFPAKKTLAFSGQHHILAGFAYYVYFTLYTSQ